MNHDTAAQDLTLSFADVPGLQCCETDAEIMRTLPTEMRKEIRDERWKAQFMADEIPGL